MKKFIFIAAILGLFSVTGFAQRGHDKKRHEVHRHNGKLHDKKYGHQQKRGRAHAYHHQPKSRPVHYRAPRHHRHGPPAWARAHRYNMSNHVYFPDYYTFYDANRGGYTYWGGSGWVFSTGMPSFLVNVDLGNARFQLMKEVPLRSAPQRYYRTYHKRFPVPRPMVPAVYIPRF